MNTGLNWWPRGRWDPLLTLFTYGGGAMATVRLFQYVNFYTAAPGGVITPVPAESVQIDLATIAANVNVDLPTVATEGQAIGVCLRTRSLGRLVTITNVEFPVTLVGPGDCALYTFSSATNSWHLVTARLVQLSWANAAERNAEVLDANAGRRVGLQADINLKYEVIGLTPTRWGALDDPSMGAPRPHVAQNSATGTLGLAQMNVTQGTANNRTQASGSALARLCRVAIVSSAVAGNSAAFRQGSTQGIAFVGGFRWRSQFGLLNPSANCWWFAGFSDTIPGAGGADPATLLNCVGVGRSATDANIQLFHNDGAGTAAKINLGASFPATAANLALELELYTFDGSSFAYQLTNLETLAQVSGTFSNELPKLTPIVGSPLYYAANNTDAVALELVYGNQQAWSRVA